MPVSARMPRTCVWDCSSASAHHRDIRRGPGCLTLALVVLARYAERAAYLLERWRGLLAFAVDDVCACG